MITSGRFSFHLNESDSQSIFIVVMNTRNGSKSRIPTQYEKARASLR